MQNGARQNYPKAAVVLDMKQPLKNNKGVGSSSSFTIPDEFIDSLTGETVRVSNDHLRLINESLDDRRLVHLVMTGIHLVSMQKTNQSPVDQEILSKLTQMEERMNAMVTLMGWNKSN